MFDPGQAARRPGNTREPVRRKSNWADRREVPRPIGSSRGDGFRAAGHLGRDSNSGKALAVLGCRERGELLRLFVRQRVNSPPNKDEALVFIAGQGFQGIARPHAQGVVRASLQDRFAAIRPRKDNSGMMGRAGQSRPVADTCDESRIGRKKDIAWLRLVSNQGRSPFVVNTKRGLPQIRPLRLASRRYLATAYDEKHPGGPAHPFPPLASWRDISSPLVTLPQCADRMAIEQSLESFQVSKNRHLGGE